MAMLASLVAEQHWWLLLLTIVQLGVTLFVHTVVTLQ
jgi:hypothetical protein